ncbi:transposase [Desulfarculales bacterium]
MLFEQAAMTLVREMPVLAAARILGASDTGLWQVVQLYVTQALSKIDLGGVKAMALEKIASKQGHNYVTVFIDLNRKQKPVIFVTPGKGQGCLVLFHRFLREHGGDHNNIAAVACDMPPASLTAIGESFPNANVTVTVDWFHGVQLFTTSMNAVRKAEAKGRKLPKDTRWTVLKAADGGRLTEKQQQTLTELETDGFVTAWQLKEMLRWIRKATSVRATQWRTTHLTRHALKCIAPDPGPQDGHDSGRACHLDPKPLDLKPFQRPPGGA